MRAWMSTGEEFIYYATPSSYIADWDSTVITKYGEQEDAEIGYNPRKPGRKSLHPLVCVIADTRLALHMSWRPGNTVSASNWVEAMEEVYLTLNRGDIGFGQEKIMAWHETEGEKRPQYLFKLKLTKNVKRALAQIKWPERLNSKQSCAIEQVAELELKLQGWSASRRVVVTRLLRETKGDGCEELWDIPEVQYQAYVTNLEPEQADSSQVVLCYRKRADSENVFDELKNQWGFEGFSSRLFVRVLSGREGHTEAVTSRYELLMLPGRLVKSSRQKKVKLSVSKKLRASLKAAYTRLEQWLSGTAPQLRLYGEIKPAWNLFLPESVSD